MSVGKTNNNGNVSVFAKAGVTIHKEKDVLIPRKEAPILIGVHDKQGCYRIPLVQRRGQWLPNKPTTTARTKLGQANSVYNLSSTEQAIKWMHVVYRYPVKSMWIKAIKAGNFMGWPVLTNSNVKKYYPETS